MSNPNPPAAARCTPRLLRWIGGIALAGYAFFLALNFSGVAGGSDSSGYLNSARLLATGQLEGKLRVPAGLADVGTRAPNRFQPWGFTGHEDNRRLTPTYPSGLPLHLAAAGTLVGWRHAPLVVGVGAALATVWLCFAVARELRIDPWLAGAGAVALAAFPPLLFASTQPLSDPLATAWCLAAVGAAVRSRSGRDRWALACGAAFALAVLVRPTSVLIAPALIGFIGLKPRRLALYLAGGAPGALWFAFYNRTLYGGAFRSGYPAIGDAFALSYAAPTALHFARWLSLFLPAVLLPLAFAPLARHAGRTREFAGLALWFGAVTAAYSCYAISQENWTCLRFILPAVPALILAGLLGLETLVGPDVRARAARWRMTTAVLIAAWAIAASTYWSRHLAIFYIKGYEQAYADACAAARAHFPENALVLSAQTSGALYFYTQFAVLRWDIVTPEEFARYRLRAAEAGVPICALIYNVEEQAALRERCPGEWRQVAAAQNIHLWQLAAADTSAALR